MKKILGILAIITVALSALVIFQLTNKTQYNQIIEIKKGQSISKSLKELPVSEEFLFKLYLKFKECQRKDKSWIL